MLSGEYPNIITENILNVRPAKALLLNSSFKNRYAQNAPNAGYIADILAVYPAPIYFIAIK